MDRYDREWNNIVRPNLQRLGITDAQAFEIMKGAVDNYINQLKEGYNASEDERERTSEASRQSEKET